ARCSRGSWPQEPGAHPRARSRWRGRGRRTAGMRERLYPPENRRWNFAAALIDAAGWGLGLGVISHDTFLPLFVTELHGSDYAVGWIKTLLAFGWYVPGILVAGMVERKARVRRFVMVLAMLERAYLLAMVPLC